MNRKRTPNLPMKKEISIVRSSAAEYLTFVAAYGKGCVEAVYADENIWLTQKMMGVLYDVETHTVNYHLKKVFTDSELQEESVIRKFRITAADGKIYDTKHYNLAAIIAVGYKVNSERAVQFRKWATGIVEEYTIKGFAMDDERLKSGGSILSDQYFEEQLQRIREIRSVLEAARSSAYRAVNTVMVLAYWQVGRLIVEHEQGGKRRATYGAAVLEDLSRRLTMEFGRGFDGRNLRYMRQFYMAFLIHDALCDESAPQEKVNALRSKSGGASKRNALRSKLPDFPIQDAASLDSDQVNATQILRPELADHGHFTRDQMYLK